MVVVQRLALWASQNQGSLYSQDFSVQSLHVTTRVCVGRRRAAAREVAVVT